MNRELLSITFQMVKPLNDLEHNLSCDIGEVVFTHPLTEMRIQRCVKRRSFIFLYK